jgi:hypothetical protein
MADLGESIAPPDFMSEVQHDKKTCPWHDESKASAKPMGETEGDDDAPMPKNLGGKLKKNMLKAGDDPPDVDKISVSYKTLDRSVSYQTVEKGKTKDRLQPIFRDSDPKEYRLQYAPHHLIPGNESLKDNPLVAFLGDDSVIKNFNDEGISSKIIEGHSVGYDVNRAQNGVWLPSPYAVTMGSNLWGAEAGLVALESAEGPAAVDLVHKFRAAYVAESIARSGGRQFHMRHVKYSELVAGILEKIAQKMIVLASGGCPLSGEKKKGDKIEPPMGLPGRLDVISGQMKLLLTGSVWRSPAFADSLTETYAATLKKAASTPPVDKIL